MSFHVGCTHAGTRVTSWLHACFRSTCRSIEFPIVTLRSYREIRSVRTRPLFQIYQELRGKRREDRCRGYDGGDPQVAVEKLLEFLFNWEMCGGRGINFGTKMQRKLNFFIRTRGKWDEWNDAIFIWDHWRESDRNLACGWKGEKRSPSVESILTFDRVDGRGTFKSKSRRCSNFYSPNLPSFWIRKWKIIERGGLF